MALAVTSLLLIAACTKDDATDFCMNHYRFHADHLNSVGELVIGLTADGRLQTELSLPFASFSDLQAEPVEAFAGIEELLSEPGRVYRLDTERDCSATTVVGVQRDGVSLNARYESSCGDDNKVGQLDIALFDEVPQLAELEVRIATPAVGKHFVINRQCSAAIFRFEQH
jgi:hypothetical protein